MKRSGEAKQVGAAMADVSQNFEFASYSGSICSKSALGRLLAQDW